ALANPPDPNCPARRQAFGRRASSMRPTKALQVSKSFGSFRRNVVRRFTFLCLTAVLCSPLQQAGAQEKSQEKPKTEERSKPPVSIKVQVVFTEYDGDKKISSMPYSFIAIPDERVGGLYSASLRTGVRIPIQTDNKDQKATYMDVGSNIDCGVRSEEDGRFRVLLIFERSALYPNK